MKPLFLGTSERTDLAELTTWGGYAEDGERIELSEEDLEAHLHGVGASRTGKSKMIEHIVRQLVKQGRGFCLVDPHGFLYQDILRWLAYVKPAKDIILFDPSQTQHVVGFNPFRSTGGDIAAQADRMVKATVKAWGAEGTDETPRLERWLRSLYYVLLEQNQSLEAAYYLLSFKEREVRQHLTKEIQSDLIRNEFEELSTFSRLPDFLQQIESARNRLFRLMEFRQVRRTVGLDYNNIDLQDIVESGKILLVNLQPTRGVLSEDSARLLGTLLVSDLWDITKHRRQDKHGRKPSDFYLIMDEFQLFLTPDIPAMLDQSAKYGLHLMLFHQHLSQLREIDERIYNSVMTNAKVKLVFGGLSDEDATAMAKQIFPGQIDLKRIKFLIEQTKFWPKVGRAKVYSQSSGQSKTHGTSLGGGIGDASTFSDGTSFGPDWPGHGGGTHFSGAAHGSSSFSFDSTIDADSTSSSEGESDVPFIYPEAFKEISSITSYSLDEMIWLLASQLREQYQRHFIIRRPGRPTVAAVTPSVKPPRVTPEALASYIESRLEKFLTSDDVDKALLQLHRRLRLNAGKQELTDFNLADIWEKPVDNE